MKGYFMKDGVYLTSGERDVLLKLLQGRKSELPIDRDDAIFAYQIASLEEKGFVKFLRDFSCVYDVRLTDKAYAYYARNPRLHNPVDWKFVVNAVLLGITAGASVAGLLMRR